MKHYIPILFLVLVLNQLTGSMVFAQEISHPRIYISADQKNEFLDEMDKTDRIIEFVDRLRTHLEPYVARHTTDPEWIVSRLQMYWKTKYSRVFVNGMDFSHGEGSAPVPTVRFSGSRDWDTDYLRPKLEDILPYMDDERGLYLQNGKKEGNPWEWVQPSETGHIIEGINGTILNLAEEAAFIYWLSGDEKYAKFASDIFIPYMEGMYHREPPKTTGDHHNALLMGLQTFEVIHERVVEPLTLCYDFLWSYLKESDAELDLFQEVFRKWADQEISFGVPDNNWNLMQAKYITYLALSLEGNDQYSDGKGQQYYIDQVLNVNSVKQKSLRDVIKNYDPETAIWPEVAGYSIMVTDDILKIFSLMDNALGNRLLNQYPTIEKAVIANFNYLFPNGFTTAYGDAKHSHIRFNSLELLAAQYRKYGEKSKEEKITAQIKRFAQDGAYSRNRIPGLFELFFYVKDLCDVPPANSFSEMVNNTFYSPNVSWIVQRNGHSRENGMMVSKNASLGNHSHANGINIELYAKGMVIAPDCAAGVSYWSKDHREYYSRFPAHNTVVVDGISDYGTMNSKVDFQVNSIYPTAESEELLPNDYTFSEVTFVEPKTGAVQKRAAGTVRTGRNGGYFIDIFRSARTDGKDKKHEYIFHSQGAPVTITTFKGEKMELYPTDELSSSQGDLVGYNYFSEKKEAITKDPFVAQFSMPSLSKENVKVNVWMRGEEERKIFGVQAPYSRAINEKSVPEELYHRTLPALVVRQKGEARERPFVAVIDAFRESEGGTVSNVEYFSSLNTNPGFIGMKVRHGVKSMDIVFQDENPAANNQFDNGEFMGSYGIVSIGEGTMKALLLNHGKRLSYGGIGVEFENEKGTCHLRQIKNGMEVSATHAVKISVPVPQSVQDKIDIMVISKGSEKIYNGKVSENDWGKVAVFDLPPLKYGKLIYQFED